MPSEIEIKLTHEEHEALIKALEDSTKLIREGTMHQHQWQYTNDAGGNRQTCQSCGETVFLGVNWNA